MPTSPLPVAPATPWREEALDWFVRRGNPDFGEPEEALFQAWLAADAGHREAFALWQQHSGEIDAIAPELRQLLQANLAYDTALDAASGRGAGRIAARQATPKAARPSRRRALLIGSYASLALASGWLGWRQWQTQLRYGQRFETRRGEQSEVTLPDGTVLQLDTQTRIAVSYYRQRRELRLVEGQVMLSVQKDPQRPFQVLAGPLQVTVVGTRFSVRHTSVPHASLPHTPPPLQQAGDDGVEVSVAQGRVRVETIGNGQSVSAMQAVYLNAGDQVSSDAQGVLAAVSHISAAQVGAWHQYRLRFVNRRLDQVLQELSRYRDLPLVIRDPEVAALQVTGVFDPRDLNTLQRVLPLSLPVRLAELADGRREVRMRR